jgi:large subunit ribosomal protein L44e
MKIPKKKKKFCPKCKKYTEHKVSVVKSGRKRGAMKEGQRRFKAKMAGYGGYPRPKPEKGTKYGAKTTKKIDIRYKCSVCGKEQTPKKGKRMKKVDMQ